MSGYEFVIVTHGKKQFETLGNTIYKFTIDFLEQNKKRSLPVTRQEVNWHWEQQVMRVYPRSDDSTRVFLLDQISCPLIEVFWEKRSDEKAFRLRRAIQSMSGFHIITRKPTALERKEHPWDIIMTHAVHGDIYVPGIVRLPLRKVKYIDLLEKILDANPTKNLTRRDLVELWAAIFEKVYDYENRWRECKRYETIGIKNDMIEALKGPNKRRPWEVEGYSEALDSPPTAKKIKATNEISELAGVPSSSSNILSSMAKADVPTSATKVQESAHRSTDSQSTKPAKKPCLQEPKAQKSSSIIQVPTPSTTHSQPLSGTSEFVPATVSKPEKPIQKPTQKHSPFLSTNQIFWP